MNRHLELTLERAFDTVVSLTVLILLCPRMVLIALVLKLNPTL